MARGDEVHQAAEQFLLSLPHCRELGMKLISVGGGKAEVLMPWDKRLVGDPSSGVIHGGAVSALMDSCCGCAALFHPQGVLATVTLDLRIDYMRPANSGQAILCQAECYNLTRTVAFMRATALDDDRGRPVATATGAFAVERP